MNARGGSSNDPPRAKKRHFHSPKMRTAPSDRSVAAPYKAVPGNRVGCEAFRVASLFKSVSSTFWFCQSSAYEDVDIQNFILQASKSRARAEKPLKRVTAFVEEFYGFATLRGGPQPFAGDECLLAITLWLRPLSIMGATIPNLGRYALRVFGVALGVRFPPRASCATGSGG